MALERARAEQLTAGWSDLAVAREAATRVHAAERALAASRGESYAEVIDLGCRWSGGAPEPHLISNGHRAVIICYAPEPDAAWDGSYVKIVSPSDQHEDTFAVITFTGCASIRFGAPNDEALHGHPLSGRGLEGYRAHEVRNSAWLEEHIKINSVHPQHSDEHWRQLSHFFLVFHDDMIEALARDMQARLERGTLSGLLAQAARDLTSA